MVQRAVGPVRMMFWGGLLCDFGLVVRFDRQGFQIDILNDVLGTLLIAVGLFRLAAIPVHSRYAIVMKFVKVVAVLAVLAAIRGHFLAPLPPAFQIVQHLFGLAALASLVAFCVAMRWFCEEAGLTEAARSWKLTTVLFVAFAVPASVYFLASGWATTAGKPLSSVLGPIGLLLPVFLIPLIHLLVSTARMERAVKEAAVEPPGQEHAGRT
jgi:hypothetical protein